MKRVITPAVQEGAVYYSDFTGTAFKYGPEAELTLEFNYGSGFDGSKLEFHLTDKEVLEVIEFIKSKISKDCINDLKRKRDVINNNLRDAIDARDYMQSDYYTNSRELINKLID